VTTFQLDQCLDDKDLARACNAEGKCTVKRYPERLRGQSDKVMLPAVFSQDTTLVTIDRTIIEDNESSIVAPNPCIIVIRTKKPRPFMTASLARRIMDRFKTNVPSWPDIDWSMVYIEINNEDEILVSPLINGDITGGRPFDISNERLDAELSAYIREIRQSLKGIVSELPT